MRDDFNFDDWVDGIREKHLQPTLTEQPKCPTCNLRTCDGRCADRWNVCTICGFRSKIGETLAHGCFYMAGIDGD